MDALLPWLPIIAVGINLVVLWIAWTIRSMAREEQRKFARDFDERLAQQERSLTQLRSRFEHSPGHNDLQTIHQRVSDIKDKVYEIGGEVKGAHADIGGLKRSMDILVSHHIREGREA